MKKYIKISIFSLAVASFVTSCDMEAPSQSSLDESSVFSVFALAEQEIMSINVSFGETNSYRGRYLPYYGVNSDVETTSGTYPSLSKKNDDKMSLCNFSTLDNNTQMNTDNNAYAKFYEGIERANLAIAGIRKYGDIENNRDMAHLLGEALTMRAVIYNDLIKAWGDVPARFTPNNSNNINLPRTNKDDIYLQLLKDLEEAENYCYWPKESHITDYAERVNKSFVKGLRARIALYACGYALRGDGYRRSNNPELSQDKMMAIVKKECLDVINSGKNTLGEFEDNFKNLCKDGADGTVSPASNLESLWEIPFSAGRGRVHGAVLLAERQPAPWRALRPHTFHEGGDLLGHPYPDLSVAAPLAFLHLLAGEHQPAVHGRGEPPEVGEVDAEQGEGQDEGVEGVTHSVRVRHGVEQRLHPVHADGGLPVARPPLLVEALEGVAHYEGLRGVGVVELLPGYAVHSAQIAHVGDGGALGLQAVGPLAYVACAYVVNVEGRGAAPADERAQRDEVVRPRARRHSLDALAYPGGEVQTPALPAQLVGHPAHDGVHVHILQGEGGELRGGRAYLAQQVLALVEHRPALDGAPARHLVGVYGYVRG